MAEQKWCGDLAIRQQQDTGPRILWVHGYTLDASLWNSLWERLPEFSHVALDLPGHGASLRQIPHNARLNDFADAVSTVADEYSADILLGLSFGATVVLQAGLNRPTRYSALLLAACGLAGGPQDRESAECNLELTKLVREKGIGSWLADRWLSCPPAIFEGVAQDPNIFAPIADVVRRHSWNELTHQSMASMARDVQNLSDMGKLRSTVSLLVGENDMAAFKRSAHLLTKAIPSANCTYVPGCGHLPLLEAPDEGAAWVRQALSNLNASA